MKGVPLRIELGPRDIEAGQCVIVTRHNREKTTVSLENIEAAVEEKLEEVRSQLFARALANRDSRTYACHTLDEVKAIREERGDGFFKLMWCGDPECEEKIKEETGVTSRCIPFEQEHLDDKCVCCGKPAQHMVYFAVAY